jgi:hypothetical protein
MAVASSPTMHSFVYGHVVFTRYEDVASEVAPTLHGTITLLLLRYEWWSSPFEKYMELIPRIQEASPFLPHQRAGYLPPHFLYSFGKVSINGSATLVSLEKQRDKLYRICSINIRVQPDDRSGVQSDVLVSDMIVLQIDCHATVGLMQPEGCPSVHHLSCG